MKTLIPLIGFFMTAVISANAAAAGKPSGDPAIIPRGAKLQTLWNKGDFTEGVAVATDGKVYFVTVHGPVRSEGRGFALMAAWWVSQRNSNRFRFC